MTDHEYIYLQPECCTDGTNGRLWCQDPDPEDCEDGVPWTKYVRFDIAQSREQALEAELRQARELIANLDRLTEGQDKTQEVMNNKMCELEAEVERLKDLLSCAHHELYDGKCKCKDCWSPGV